VAGFLVADAEGTMTGSEDDSRTPAARPTSDWPEELGSIGAIRFGRTYYHYDEAVRFYRDLVGLPLYEQFEGSYGENGSIFVLPTPGLTFEIVEGTEPTPGSHYEALCLYFPDEEAKQAALSRLKAAGIEPADSHPYWAAHGGVTYRDPDGRQVVFAPFVYGKNEPPERAGSGRHTFPSDQPD
jgi:catechol 2,3-dioxygenase-like lactoylglutathione lyase family enzyme